MLDDWRLEDVGRDVLVVTGEIIEEEEVAGHLEEGEEDPYERHEDQDLLAWFGCPWCQIL